MYKEKLKVISGVAFAALIAVIALLSINGTLPTFVAYLFVAFMGLYFIYGYCFNTEIYITGYTVRPNEHIWFRRALGALGFVIVAWVCYLLVHGP